MAPGKERRNFYRVEDMLFLEYRPVSTDELQRQTHDQGIPRPPRSAVMDQFSNINRHLVPLINDIRRDDAKLAQYLETINKKIDLLASHAQFTGATGDDDKGMIRITTNTNLSEGGMAFHCKSAPATLSYVHIRATSKISGIILETYARVIAVDKEQSPNLHMPYRVRVEFPYLDDSEKKLLSKHLVTRQREDLRRRNADEPTRK